MKTYFLSLVVGSLCSCVAEPRPRVLTVEDARGLVMAGLPKQTRRLPGLYFEGGKVIEKARCAPFNVLWANRGPGSVHVDLYTVDLQTGALWRGVPIVPVTTPGVVRTQRSLRKRLGITEREYQEAIEGDVCN
jgi:hypothetical protein